MTSEEKAVIQAAIRFYRAHEFGRDQLGSALIEAGQGFDEAVRALIHSCPDCNHDTHRCPGCGLPIQHLDGACRKCTERVEQEAREHLTGVKPPYKVGDTVTVGGIEFTKHAELPDVEMTVSSPLSWVRRTWLDVRMGDRVRLPGTDSTAYVKHCVHRKWNVDTLNPAYSEYRPGDFLLRWKEVHVTLIMPAEAGKRVIDFPPNGPIDIELSAAEVSAIETIGWENRVALITEEVSE